MKSWMFPIMWVCIPILYTLLAGYLAIKTNSEIGVLALAAVPFLYIFCVIAFWWSIIALLIIYNKSAPLPNKFMMFSTDPKKLGFTPSALKIAQTIPIQMSQRLNTSLTAATNSLNRHI